MRTSLYGVGLVKGMLSTYNPKLSKELLDSDMSPLEFYVEDPSNLGQDPPVMIPNLNLQSVVPGQFISCEDLNVIFCVNGVMGISPIYLSYLVGYFNDDTDELIPIGNASRTPVKTREGRYHPSFQVGDNWRYGRYAIRWSYIIDNDSSMYERDTLFWVVSSGLTGGAERSAYIDIQATIIIVE